MDVPFSAVPHWLQWVLVAAAALATIGGGVRAVPPLWQFLRRVISLVDALGELEPFLKKNDPILDELNKQIVNDHGHVILRNQLDRIEDTSKRLDTALADAVERLDRVETGVAGLYDDQKALSERFDDAENTWRRDNHTPDSDHRSE
ncbi:hypothetical protein [Gryllotalpicola koreensis]|uniref:DUF2746 domain-containing protein n=1 Tax=Gryllotalpicola koreensis TaxID=993086 RepID=A0ABP8A393_9MICO